MNCARLCSEFSMMHRYNTLIKPLSKKYLPLDGTSTSQSIMAVESMTRFLTSWLLWGLEKHYQRKCFGAEIKTTQTIFKLLFKEI